MAGDIELDVYSVNAPGDTTTFLATLDDAYGKEVRFEHNGTGFGRFKLNRSSPNATPTILARGNLVKVRVPDVSGDPIGSFFLEKGDFTLISRDEEGGEEIGFEGRGALAYWDRAIWLSQVFTTQWWPACMDPGGPHPDATGVVEVASGPAQTGDGNYRIYTVDPLTDEITGYSWFTTEGFCASFNEQRTRIWPGANPAGALSPDNKRYLVKLLDGPAELVGKYFAPHQAGVTKYLKSTSKTSTGIETTFLLSDVADTPGAVVKYLYDEAQDAARPSAPLALMTVDFTDTLDSDGNAWTASDALAGLNARAGDQYLQTLAQLLGTGVLDVEMGPDLDMHAWNAPHGRDLTGGAFGAGVVRWEKGSNIADELKRELADQQAATFAEVAGTDDVFAQAELPDAATRVAREIAVRGDSADEATLEAIGLAELNLRLGRADAMEFAIPVGSDEATGRYLPGPSGTSGHFWLGDSVTVHTGTASPDFNEATLRVTAIGLSEDDAGSLLCTVEVRQGSLPRLQSAGLTSPAFFATESSCPFFIPAGSIDGFADHQMRMRTWENEDDPSGFSYYARITGPTWTAGAPNEYLHMDGGVTLYSGGSGMSLLTAGGGFELLTEGGGVLIESESGGIEIQSSGGGGIDISSGGGMTIEAAGSMSIETPDLSVGIAGDFGTTGEGLVSNGAGGVEWGTVGSAITVQDEGTPLATGATTLNFVGAGVTATGTGATKTITVPGPDFGETGDIQPVGEVAAAGATGEVADAGHVHTIDADAVRNAGHWEVLMTPGVTSPPEPVWTPDGTDYVWVWVAP